MQSIASSASTRRSQPSASWNPAPMAFSCSHVPITVPISRARAAGETRPVRIEIELNNSAGIFQVDDLLATKIRGTPLEGKIEVAAEIEGETEKRLLSGFRLDSL